MARFWHPRVSTAISHHVLRDALQLQLKFFVEECQRVSLTENTMAHVPIEPDEIDDLPAYPSSSSAPLPSLSPQPQVQGRINNIAGEVASDRRYTGGDTLDEPVSTTIVHLTTERESNSSYVMVRQWY
jgi:hypothetical protein